MFSDDEKRDFLVITKTSARTVILVRVGADSLASSSQPGQKQKYEMKIVTFYTELDPDREDRIQSGSSRQVRSVFGV